MKSDITQHAIAYLGAAATFFALDFLWLGAIAKQFYRDRLGALMADQINVAPAVLFYLVYVVGILVFAVAPSLASGSWRSAALYGGLFGFFCYATYDFTNLATLRGWPLSLVVVDVAWGTVLTALAATAGYAAVRLVQ